MSPVIALLRAVNVGGRTVTSAQLKAVAADLGHTAVTTYVNSGNLVLVPAAAPMSPRVCPPRSPTSSASTSRCSPARSRSGRRSSTPCRSPTEATADPAHLVAVFWDGPSHDGHRLRPRPLRPRDGRVGGARDVRLLPRRQGRSKLTIDVLSKAAGRVGTARNWNTVLALQKLARERV